MRWWELRLTYIHHLVKQTASGEAAVKHRKLSSMLCNHLDGWDGELERKGPTRGGMHLCIQLIHFVAPIKLIYIIQVTIHQ